MKNIYIIGVLLFVTTLLYSQKIKILSGSFDELKNTKSFNLTFSYDRMRVIMYSDEDEYINERTEAINKKEEGKGELWKAKWLLSKEEVLQPTLEKKLANVLSIKGISVGQNIEADYTIVVNITLCDYGMSKKNRSKRVSTFFDYKIVETKSSKIVIKTSEVMYIGGKQSVAGGFSPGYGIRVPSPWDNYSVISRLKIAYAKSGKTLGEFLLKQL